MLQHYSSHSPEEHGIWRFLYNRQFNFLKNRASEEFFSGIKQLHPVLGPDLIPNINDLNTILFEKTGWKVELVNEILPKDLFFSFLAKRRWVVINSIRKAGSFNFVPTPDLFHDLFGHIPLLTNEHYAGFMQKIGETGLISQNDPLILRQLERIFCFTIDYGFIEENGENRIYGAGILSSFRETNCTINKKK